MPCAPCSTNQRQETDMGHAHDHGHTHDDAPLMEDLLRNAPSNWGRWGPDDEVGALNFLTPAEVLRGVSHIRSGETFTLQRLIGDPRDRKSTRLNSSHLVISYAVFCLKKKKITYI